MQVNWKPTIVAFCCNWCSYAGADLSGTNRLQYPANVKIIRIPCSCRLNPMFILRAFQRGADGVILCGCHPGDCHYTTGNYYARRRMTLLFSMLDFLGVEKERTRVEWVSAAEGAKFAATMNEFVKTITELGENRRLEDADGLQMSFQRVKIPAGGTLQFEMPSDDPDNPDYEKTLVGVILHNHATCAYWPAGSEYDDDTTPLCSSVDGKVGIGTPGGACAACVMNRFGSAPDGSKGKACKNMRVLYLLRSGEYMPLQVNLPPTSIKPFKEFLNRAFMLRRRATYGSIVQIGLKRENNGTNDYSVATFKLLQDFQGEELAQIRAYANSFKEQIKLLLQQRAEITEEQRDTGCDYVIEPGAMTNEPADGHYTVSQINGDCEQLPA